jgi:DNA-directed RNA polymerase
VGGLLSTFFFFFFTSTRVSRLQGNTKSIMSQEKEAMTVLEKLTADLAYRMKSLDNRNRASYLKDLEPTDIIEFSYSHVLKGLERHASLVEVSTSIGRRLRQKLKLPQDSILDAQGGWFVLITYIELNILGYKKKHMYKNGKKDKHRSYNIFVKDWKSIKDLIDLVDSEKCDMFPVNEPPTPWTGEAYHKATGISVIKKGHESALKYFEKNDMTYLTDVLNKLNNTAWRINEQVFSVYQECMFMEKNPFKFTREIDPVKRASLIIEVEAIQRLAEKNLGKPFYHLYNLDFRGRIYPNTAFLHEQSSDNAKGLLLLDEPVCLGDKGCYWLSVHTSNVWGNDKVSLDDRAKWVSDNMDDILLYAENPLHYTGWMEADKPFSFLAACYEFSMLSNWHGDGYATEDFPSCLPIYIDGSNNGVQHLVAMSKDEEVAPLVNLTPQTLPGDVYMFIADKVWDNLEKLQAKLKPELVVKFDELFDTARGLQREYEDSPDKSERKAIAFRAAQTWRNENRDLREKLFPVYWLRIEDKKTRRKTVKRNVMTLGYGGTAYGMGQQVIEDTRDLSEYLRDKEHLWGAMLGTLVYKTCYEELKGPARLLSMFQELAGRSNTENIHLQWFSPVTNFPVVQAYLKPITKRTELKYGEDLLKVNIQVWEEAVINESKQRTGAAPNIVHSLDAVHLTMVVHDAPYKVTVVHDSFGCNAGNMGQMFKHVRLKFVELYKQEPLELILAQLNSLDLSPEKGTLDVNSVMGSDFAFA